MSGTGAVESARIIHGVRTNSRPSSKRSQCGAPSLRTSTEALHRILSSDVVTAKVGLGVGVAVAIATKPAVWTQCVDSRSSNSGRLTMPRPQQPGIPYRRIRTGSRPARAQHTGQRPLGLIEDLRHRAAEQRARRPPAAKPRPAVTTAGPKELQQRRTRIADDADLGVLVVVRPAPWPGDRGAQSAEFVDQATLECVGTGPDPAAGHRVDGLDAELAALRDPFDEIGVEQVGLGLDLSVLLGR